MLLSASEATRQYNVIKRKEKVLEKAEERLLVTVSLLSEEAFKEYVIATTEK